MAKNCRGFGHSNMRQWPSAYRLKLFDNPIEVSLQSRLDRAPIRHRCGSGRRSSQSRDLRTALPVRAFHSAFRTPNSALRDPIENLSPLEKLVPFEEKRTFLKSKLVPFAKTSCFRFWRSLRRDLRGVHTWVRRVWFTFSNAFDVRRGDPRAVPRILSGHWFRIRRQPRGVQAACRSW